MSLTEDRDVSEALEEWPIREYESVELVECPDCGFEFHVMHESEPDGGYDCPACAERHLRSEINDLREKLEGSREWARQIHEALDTDDQEGALEKIRDLRERLEELREAEDE